LSIVTSGESQRERGAVGFVELAEGRGHDVRYRAVRELQARRYEQLSAGGI